MLDPKDIMLYIDSKDMKTVAAAARRLDHDALLSGNITRDEFVRNLYKSDKELYMEREKGKDTHRRGPA